ELYQTDIFYSRTTGQFTNYGPDAGHTSWQLDAGGNITAPGDVIFTAEYSSSSLTAIEARIWIDRSTMSITPAAFDWIGGFDGASTGAQFGYANIRPKTVGAYYTGLQSGNNTWAGPFGFIDGGNNFLTTYSARQYMEFSVNLSKLGLDPITLLGGSACGLPFRRILVKSRTSTSFSSELKDFIGPFDFFVTAPVEAVAEVPLFCGVISVSDIQVLNPLASSVYTWSTPDGNIVGDTTGTTIRADAPGTYIVSQQLLDGCSSTSRDTVTIVFDSTCVPLVNGITEFKGSIDEGNKTNLTWTTQENEMVSSFEVERSTNGSVFKSVEDIYAIAKQTSNVVYKTLDNLTGINAIFVFYRLKINYTNGTSGYSRVIKLSHKAEISAYPNPSDKYLQINIPSSAKGEATIRVYDLSGKGLYNKKIETDEGMTQHTIKDLSKWHPGVYMLNIEIEKRQLWHKIIIMHSKQGINYLNSGPF
nr:T9SS type A sorting domain-containing protein [Segetibacter sp.]